MTLQINKLHLWRGDRHLLRGVSLSASTGQAVQLLWPNGVGKTSLLRCIAGFLHAEEGEVTWQGVSTTRDRDAFHRDLAWLGQDTALKPDLTVMENLRFACSLREPRSDERIVETLKQLGLPDIAREQTVRTLSAGQHRRVALARLALWNARLWLLDEPAAHLDATGQHQLCELLATHLQGGGIVLVATHLPLALGHADSRNWLDPGAAI